METWLPTTAALLAFLAGENLDLESPIAGHLAKVFTVLEVLTKNKS